MAMGWYGRYRIVWIRAFARPRREGRGDGRIASLCHNAWEIDSACLNNVQSEAAADLLGLS
jgi:hypothetical protein